MFGCLFFISSLLTPLSNVTVMEISLVESQSSFSNAWAYKRLSVKAILALNLLIDAAKMFRKNFLKLSQ